MCETKAQAIETTEPAGRVLGFDLLDLELLAQVVDHPWPERLAVGWPAADRITEYIKVEPTLVVEVWVDVAAQAGRWRHGLRYLHVRAELLPQDVPTDLDTA